MRTCAVLTGKSLNELYQKAIEASQRGADLVELRIDLISDFSDIGLLETFPLPMIISCVYDKKTDLTALKRVLRFKAEFVDMDVMFPAKSVEEIFSLAKLNGIKTILSYYPERFPIPKKIRKRIKDMAMLSKHLKFILPAKNEKNLESLQDVFKISKKMGTKSVVISSGEKSYETATDPKNFIGYGKTDNSRHTRYLPDIETVKKSIMENVEARSY